MFTCAWFPHIIIITEYIHAPFINCPGSVRWCTRVPLNPHNYIRVGPSPVSVAVDWVHWLEWPLRNTRFNWSDENNSHRDWPRVRRHAKNIRVLKNPCCYSRSLAHWWHDHLSESLFLHSLITWLGQRGTESVRLDLLIIDCNSVIGRLLSSIVVQLNHMARCLLIFITRTCYRWIVNCPLNGYNNKNGNGRRWKIVRKLI